MNNINDIAKNVLKSGMLKKAFESVSSKKKDKKNPTKEELDYLKAAEELLDHDLSEEEEEELIKQFRENQ